MSPSRTKIQIAALVIANPLIFASILKFVPCPIMNCYSCPWALCACPIGTIQCLLSIGIIPFYTMGILSLIGAHGLDLRDMLHKQASTAKEALFSSEEILILVES